MRNIIIKNKIKELNENVEPIISNLLLDSTIEMFYRKRIDEDILERLLLIYLSLFGENNYLEYEDLTISEKNIIWTIISKGIASIYVDDEYLTPENTSQKLIIIDDMIYLLCILTGFERAIVRSLIIREIKVYFNYGWKWDFI